MCLINPSINLLSNCFKNPYVPVFVSSLQTLLSLNIFFIAVAVKPSGSGCRFLVFLRFSSISPVGVWGSWFSTRCNSKEMRN